MGTNKRLTFLVFATEWESAHGGISTFNRELCAALGDLGHRVYCALPRISDGELLDARTRGVTLVTSRNPEVHPAGNKNLTRPLLGIEGAVDYLVGHGRITGHDAVGQLLDHYNGAAYVHFVHMDPGAIESHKGTHHQAAARIDEERSLASHAVVAAAVGPELFRKYQVYLRTDGPIVHEFVPGLFDEPTGQELPELDNPAFLVLGRAEDVSPKGLDVAAVALERWAEHHREHDRFTLFVLGAPPDRRQEVESQLQGFVSSSRIQIQVEEFTPARAKVVRQLRSVSLLLMPSREEGFGLVGLEAISYGVPVLISTTSGLARSIVRAGVDPERRWTFDVDGETSETVRKIQAIVGDLPGSRNRIQQMREVMQAEFNWKRSAQLLVERLENRPGNGGGRGPNQSPGPLKSYLSTFGAKRKGVQEETFELFKLASTQLLEWPRTLEATGRWLEREEMKTLRAHVAGSELTPLVITGGPGTGKSALLAQLGNELVEAGTCVLAIKADMLPITVLTNRDLGAELGLAGSVLDVLAAASKHSRVVLLIDQIDALADSLVIHNARLSVLLDTAKRASRMTNVRVLLSCRTFELDHDMRIRAMNVQGLVLGPLDESLVRECLPVGVSPTPGELETLRTPQWLNLYLRFRKFGGTMMSTLQEFWNETFLRDASLEETALALAQEMCRREEIWLAPEVVTQVATASELEKLRRANVLTLRAKIGFSHQTIFEFAQLRSFLKKDVSLLVYARSKEFALATRATIRSALMYLREVDAEKYRSELLELLGAADLRMHLRLMIVAWLGGQRNLKPFEKSGMKTLWNDETGNWVTHSVRNNEEWFDVFEAFLPELMRDTRPRSRHRALAFLEGALPTRTEKVIQLANEHWLDVPATARYLGHLASSAKDWVEQLLPLAASAVRMLVDEDDKTYPFASVSSIISSVLKHSPRAAVNLCAEYCSALLNYEPKADEARMNRGIARVYFENPHEQWFLEDLARAAPEEFMQHVWPRLVCMLEKVSERRGYGYNPSSSISTAYPPDPDDRDGWMIAVHEAVETMVKRDGSFLQRFVTSAKTSSCETVHAVIIDLLRKNLPRSAQLAVDYLLEDDRRFVVERVSFHDEPSLSEELLMDLKPSLSEDQRQVLSTKIQRLDWTYERSDWPAITAEFRLSLNRRDARTRDELSRALTRGRPKLSNTTKRRSHGLQVVRSGMSAAQMLKATDEDVRTFLAPLKDEKEWRHPDRWLMGGSIEASRELADAAKSNPQRFLAVIRHLDKEHQRPITYVLDALTDRLSMSEFEEHLHFFLERGYFAQPEHASSLAWSIGKMLQRRELPSQRTLAVLNGWLVDSEPTQGSIDPEPRGVSSLLFSHGSFASLPEGNYPILRTLGRALKQFGTPEAKEHWFSVLEEHARRTESSKVWIALLNSDGVLFPLGERREKLTDMLFSRFPNVRDSREGMALILRSRDQVASTTIRRWCEQIANGSWHLGKQALGELLLFLACDSVAWADEQLQRYLNSARVEDDAVREGIALASPHMFANNREFVSETMCKLINVVSDQALDAMAHAFYNTKFVDRYIENLLAALEPRWVLHVDLGHMTRLLEMLKQRDEEQAANVLWQLVNAASKRERLPWIDRDFVDLTLALQRADSLTARQLGLNSFERLLEIGAFGVTEALDSLDNETRRFER